MAISGSRSESTARTSLAQNRSARTGLIWWCDVGNGGQESNRPAGVANNGTAVYGVALNASGNRAGNRKPAIAINDRAVQT